VVCSLCAAEITVSSSSPDDFRCQKCRRQPAPEPSNQEANLFKIRLKGGPYDGHEHEVITVAGRLPRVLHVSPDQYRPGQVTIFSDFTDPDPDPTPADGASVYQKESARVYSWVPEDH